MDKGILRNFTVVAYKETRDRYLKFKHDRDLTHDEALNELLENYERKGLPASENRNEKTKFEQNGEGTDNSKL